MNGQNNRFRNRKINFKVKLPIHTGSFDISYDDPNEGQPEGKAEGKHGGERREKVETGVDKEEEGVRPVCRLCDAVQDLSYRRSTCRTSSRHQQRPSLSALRAIDRHPQLPLSLPRKRRLSTSLRRMRLA